MKDLIKHAYNIKEGYSFFNSIDKATILLLYKELDYVYDLLESFGIVSRYNLDKFEIEKDFIVDRGMDLGTKPYIYVDDKVEYIDIDRIINDLFKFFNNPPLILFAILSFMKRRGITESIEIIPAIRSMFFKSLLNE